MLDFKMMNSDWVIKSYIGLRDLISRDLYVIIRLKKRFIQKFIQIYPVHTLQMSNYIMTWPYDPS